MRGIYTRPRRGSTPLTRRFRRGRAGRVWLSCSPRLTCVSPCTRVVLVPYDVCLPLVGVTARSLLGITARSHDFAGNADKGRPRRGKEALRFDSGAAEVPCYILSLHARTISQEMRKKDGRRVVAKKRFDLTPVQQKSLASAIRMQPSTKKTYVGAFVRVRRRRRSKLSWTSMSTHPPTPTNPLTQPTHPHTPLRPSTHTTGGADASGRTSPPPIPPPAPASNSRRRVPEPRAPRSGRRADVAVRGTAGGGSFGYIKKKTVHRLLTGRGVRGMVTSGGSSPILTHGSHVLNRSIPVD